MQAALPSVSLNTFEWFSFHYSCLVSSEHSFTLPLHLCFSKNRVSLAEVLRFPLLIKRPLRKQVTLKWKYSRLVESIHCSLNRCNSQQNGSVQLQLINAFNNNLQQKTDTAYSHMCLCIEAGRCISVKVRAGAFVTKSLHFTAVSKTRTQITFLRHVMPYGTVNVYHHFRRRPTLLLDALTVTQSTKKFPVSHSI